MEYNKLIDHTLLKADATEEEIVKLCKEAKEYNFMSVCVNPCFIEVAKRELEGSDVKVCVVTGFPLGASRPEVKAFESKDAVEHGADEIDVVINIGALKDHKDEYVLNELKMVRNAIPHNVLKVIIECCLLNEEEIIRASKLVKESGAEFVKTSTGFSKWGAKLEDVALMRKTVGAEMGVKAAGGVKTYEDMIKFVEAGATRIGTSNGVALMKK